ALSVIDGDKPLEITVDGSSYAKGAVITQDDGKRLIGFWSNQMNKSEENKVKKGKLITGQDKDDRKYVWQIECEIAAMKGAVEHYSYYITLIGNSGKPIKIYSDSKILVNMLKKRKTFSSSFEVTDQVMNLLYKLTSYPIEFIHISAKDNKFADYLSRLRNE